MYVFPPPKLRRYPLNQDKLGERAEFILTISSPAAGSVPFQLPSECPPEFKTSTDIAFMSCQEGISGNTNDRQTLPSRPIHGAHLGFCLVGWKQFGAL